MLYDIVINLNSYIAHPYWPEREQVINIVKQSGMSRARSTANRQKALEEYLKASGMTVADYERLAMLADRQFYTAGDRIIVPELHVVSMLVNATMRISAARRPCPADQLRSLIRAGDWMTEKTASDGVWRRFAVVTAGTGAKLSNQRALRENEYIGDPPGEPGGGVRATGSVSLDPGSVNLANVRGLLAYAGENVGIGASRKMGWGRFSVTSFSERGKR